MLKIRHIITTSILVSLMTGCVTKNYENNAETPIVENTSTDNEIALTRISLAMGYLNMGNTTQAKLNLEKAKRFAPNLTQVYTAFAQYYDTVDEPEQAIIAFERALKLDPNDADTLNNYGVFLCKRKQYKESEIVLLKAIAVPSYLLVSQSYENIALCQLEDKKFDKAEMYLAKSISHSPSRAAALYQMLRLQYAMGNYPQAVQYLGRYEKSVRRFNPSALALAYKVYERMNNQRIAKNYANLLVEMFPNSYEANQYILNGLRRIEADNLARDFLLVTHKTSNKPKKRVMVLSPKTKSGISLSSSKKTKADPDSLENNEVSNTALLDNPAEINSEIEQITTLSDKGLSSEEENKKTEPNIPDSISSTLNDIDLSDEKSSLLLNEKTEKQDETLPLDDESKVKLGKASVDESGNRLVTLPIHVVELGDSLYSISKRYNLKMYQIERWNDLKRSEILNIGDVIYLTDPKKAVKR